MKNITIFLDIDGVLNTYYYRMHNTKALDSVYVVDNSLVKNLRNAIFEYDDIKFEIVISSTWRIEFNHPEYYELFLGKSLTDLINKERPFTPRLGNRDREITAYMNSVDIHGRPFRVNEFIIIDDIRMDSFSLRRRQVLTDDYNGGFNDKAVEDFHKLVRE